MAPYRLKEAEKVTIKISDQQGKEHDKNFKKTHLSPLVSLSSYFDFHNIKNRRVNFG